MFEEVSSGEGGDDGIGDDLDGYWKDDGLTETCAGEI